MTFNKSLHSDAQKSPRAAELKRYVVNMKILITIILFYPLISLSAENGMYRNNKYGFEFEIPDNLCVAKTEAIQVHIFDKETNFDNKINIWDPISEIVGANVNGLARGQKNFEFIDKTLDEHLANAPAEFNDWINKKKYITGKLISAEKIYIKNIPYIKKIYTIYLNNDGVAEFENIKQKISGLYRIQFTKPNDIFRAVQIQGIKDEYQYDIGIIYRKDYISEEVIEHVINSFSLISIDSNKEYSIANINCHKHPEEILSNELKKYERSEDQEADLKERKMLDSIINNLSEDKKQCYFDNQHKYGNELSKYCYWRSLQYAEYSSYGASAGGGYIDCSSIRHIKPKPDIVKLSLINCGVDLQHNKSSQPTAESGG
jgi:hypothetical protein